MTSLLDPEAPAVPADGSASPWAAGSEHVTAVMLLVWWAVPMTRADGGQGTGVLTGAVLLALGLLVAARRHVPRACWAFVLAVPLGGLVVCLSAPTGWAGADDVAAYTVAALTVSGMTGYARSAARRDAVVALICLAGVLQFSDAFLAWWGGEDPSRPMVGTFYVWNPYAAFLLPGALLGVALVVSGRRPWRLVGWFSAPLCSAGIVFSSSRATLALLVAADLALLLLCVEREVWRPRLVRWFVIVALSGAVVFAFSGPPFFSHRAAPNAAAEAKAQSGQSVETNGAYRVGFMKGALAVAKDRPLVGSGPHGLAAASRPLVPAGTARSNLVHNGFLQPLTDGGLALGLPFLLGAGALMVAGVRRLVSARSEVDEREWRVALPVVLGAAMAHAAVDIDWSYGSDLLLTALLGALVLALRPAPGVLRGGRAVVVLAAAVALVVAVAAGTWRSGTTDQALYAGIGSAREKAAALHALGEGPLRDYRVGLRVLQLATGQDFLLEDGGVDPGDVRWALDSTRKQASIDASTQVFRARALLVLGEDARAYALAEELLRGYGPARAAGLSPLLAPVIGAAGHDREAVRLLVRYLRGDSRSAFAGVQVHVLLQILPGSADDLKRCAYALVPSDSRLPTTTDPGTPGPGVDCTAVLQGAAS